LMPAVLDRIIRTGTKWNRNEVEIALRQIAPRQFSRICRVCPNGV
jgi:hypothetical protein